ncbi:MAG: carbohydrate ABC transporter permease [Oscillospiraceae bacterium]
MASKKVRAYRKPRSRQDFIFDTVVFIIVSLIFIMVAYPLYFIVISSVSSPSAVAGGEVSWYPIGFTLEGYAAVFKENEIISGFINALYYTVVGTLINLVVTLPAAYALSRNDLRGKKYIIFFFMLTMFISGGLIPTYLVVQKVHMIDTIWALVIPGGVSVYNMIVAITFFRSSLPGELLEAARLDGCGNTRFFLKIALPLSSAIIAILVLYYGVGHWNAYFSAFLYITTPEKFPLQVVLRTILVQNSMQQSMSAVSAETLAEVARLKQVAELMKYSLIIVSSIPVLLLYPLVQKHFVKGVMIGSVKG